MRSIDDGMAHHRQTRERGVYHGLMLPLRFLSWMPGSFATESVASSAALLRLPGPLTWSLSGRQCRTAPLLLARSPTLH